MLGIFPGLRKLRIHISFSGRKSLWKKRTPFLVGLCNGFMPCGPLQSMEIVALASGSWASGAFSMFCFSLGTVPLMLGFGSIFSALGKKFTRQILKTGAILVVVMGLAMMSQGVRYQVLVAGPAKRRQQKRTMCRIMIRQIRQWKKMECSMFPVYCVLDGIRILL